jgi:hypothetical protein
MRCDEVTSDAHVINEPREGPEDEGMLLKAAIIVGRILRPMVATPAISVAVRMIPMTSTSCVISRRRIKE